MIIRAAFPAFAFAALALAMADPAAADTSFSQVMRGKALVEAGDCQGCHTTKDGKPFAGGLPLATPFGVIYTPNITPDRETGIGAWSADDFYRAMHEGRAPDGDRLYPAFPYPYYTKVTREDVDAIRAYLATLPAVHNETPRNRLMWPLNWRFLMAGWNGLFFKPGTFHANSEKSAEWNRGAYLVEGLGHCGACHTPKNVFGADKESAHLEGGVLEHWHAPDLTADRRTGLGAWSKDDIVTYLKTGRNGKSQATGPMSDVITYSTSRMSDPDLEAIAIYLKDLPGHDNDEADRQESPDKPSQNVALAGEGIYHDQCAACHQFSGEGIPGMFPPLKGNAQVQAKDPTTVIRVILEGARTVPTDAKPTPSSMPAYNWKLKDDEIAAVASYIRSQWGNAAAPVSADAVRDLRKEIHAKAE